MNKNYEWYGQLKKPSWSPPRWLFAPVWTFLYLLIAISFGTVFYKAAIGTIGWIIALPFILNLIFNFSYSPIEFRLKNNILAAIDSFLIWVTIIWAFLAIWPYAPWIAYINAPYFLWVSFATVLQTTIAFLNKK